MCLLENISRDDGTTGQVTWLACDLSQQLPRLPFYASLDIVMTAIAVQQCTLNQRTHSCRICKERGVSCTQAPPFPPLCASCVWVLHQAQVAGMELEP